MGSMRTFILIAAAATALPGIATAQEQRVFVTGAAQDRETLVTVIGAAQDREQRVTVIGAANDRRAAAENPAGRSLPTIPVVYEDEPAPAPAPARPAPVANPTR